MELQALIVNHLRRITEPCNVVELAHALGILEPGDVVPERLRSTLTGLVRHQQIKRIHNGDGVLRYSLVADSQAKTARIAPPPVSTAPAATPAAEPDPASPPAAQRAQPQRPRYETGVSDRVLAVMVKGAPPVPRVEIERRIYPPLKTTQVLSALIALARKGLVVRVGNTAGARWMLKETAALPPGRTANIDAAHAALLQARLAVDAALQALEA